MKKQYIDTGLCVQDLEAIAREMEVGGFKVADIHDCVFYWYLGSDKYMKLVDASFRYSCIEAEHLKYPVGSKRWAELHTYNKSRMWSMIYESFPDLKTRDFASFVIEPQTDEEMRKHVIEKYRPKGH